MPPELTKLLEAAFRLLDSGASVPLDTIRIGGRDFRVIAERHEQQGWILVLMPEPDPVPCVYTLMERYGLTERQVEVARLLAERYTDREMADALGVTLATAQRHAQNVMKKLRVSSRKDVAALLRESCPENGSGSAA
jgi:DNA-binding CsgD family transcriptional regulator